MQRICFIERDITDYLSDLFSFEKNRRELKVVGLGYEDFAEEFIIGHYPDYFNRTGYIILSREINSNRENITAIDIGYTENEDLRNYVRVLNINKKYIEEYSGIEVELNLPSVLSKKTSREIYVKERNISKNLENPNLRKYKVSRNEKICNISNWKSCKLDFSSPWRVLRTSCSINSDPDKRPFLCLEELLDSIVEDAIYRGENIVLSSALFPDSINRIKLGYLIDYLQYIIHHMKSPLENLSRKIARYGENIAKKILESLPSNILRSSYNSNVIYLYLISGGFLEKCSENENNSH